MVKKQDYPSWWITQKEINNNLFWATAYPLIALALLIAGIVKSETIYIYASIIIGFVAWYWIAKAWNIHQNIKGKEWEANERARISRQFKRSKRRHRRKR